MPAPGKALEACVDQDNIPGRGLGFTQQLLSNIRVQGEGIRVWGSGLGISLL